LRSAPIYVEGLKIRKSGVFPPIQKSADPRSCEFIFSRTAEWDFTLPGKLHNEIKYEYEGKPRAQNVQTIFPPQSDQPGIAIQNEVARIQFPTSDGTRLVSVGKSALSISILPPYEGWELFKQRIERALRSFRQVANPDEIIRIGIRYINRITVPSAAADATTYFRYQLSHDDVVGAKIISFMRRFEYITEDDEKILITHATIAPSDPQTTEFILDIDAIWDKEPFGFDNVTEITERLHKREGETFESIITDEARKLFDA
jgi:uncharacterized protein (TIGR04255 family)